ncbi:hypothetical protein GCM10009646_71800 [Streptomyces aureus]
MRSVLGLALVVACFGRPAPANRRRSWGAVGCRDEELVDIGGPGEAQDGAAAEAEFTGDGSQAVAA